MNQDLLWTFLDSPKLYSKQEKVLIYKIYLNSKEKIIRTKNSEF